MNDVCNFIPPKNLERDIKCHHFVYETAIKTLRQPFLHSFYYMYLAVKGSAVFKINGQKYKVSPGTLFFSFPYQSHEIVSSDDFTYLYITFDGSMADNLLKSLKIGTEKCVFTNFEHILNFWMSALRRIRSDNANSLTESVLLYTLSFIDSSDSGEEPKENNRFDLILEYIENNFTDPATTLKKVSDIFFYNEKYFSSLFKKKTGVNFTDYLNNLRIQYALKLLEERDIRVLELAATCGYNDSFYFSKVFKKITGTPPTSYIKNNKA